MPWQGGQGFGRWKWNMKKEPNWCGYAQTSKRQAERNEVIVMHPDDVVIAERPNYRARESLIHFAIERVAFVVERGEIEPSMKQWPKAPVGMLLIITVEFLLRKVDRCQSECACRCQRGQGIRLFHNLAAPA